MKHPDNAGGGDSAPDRRHESKSESPKKNGRCRRTASIVIDDELGVVIYKTPASDRWYVQYNHPTSGQKKPSLKTKNQKRAEALAKSIAAKLRLGMMESTPTRKDIRIDEATKLMLERMAAIGRKPSTIEIYERGLGQLMLWGKDHGVTKLSHLTPLKVAEFENALRTKALPLPPQEGKRPQKRSTPNVPRTIRGKMQLIMKLLKWAVQQKHLTEHPCPHYEIPAGPRRERAVYSPEDIRLILEDPDTAARDVWRLFRITGVRAGEMCWFTKEDVCQSPWGLHVRAKKCPFTGEPWWPKNNKSRFVPVTDADGIAHLQKLLAKPGHWLLVDEKGRRWTNSRLLDRLRRRRKQVNIKRANLHMFRHTLATFLANNPNVPPTHVQKLLGHSDIKVTMGYVHTKSLDVEHSLSRVDFSQMVARARTDGTTDGGDQPKNGGAAQK
jgi:integrase